MFLEENWEKIQPTVPTGNERCELVAQAFLYPWSSDRANMDMIAKFIKLFKPKVVIELGTFEGYGTRKMATAMSEAGGGKLFTFDAGKAPVNSLGPTYGVTEEFIKEGNLVDWENIASHEQGWRSWKQVIEQRNRILSANYPNVEITFVEGVTTDTLPLWMEKIGQWDLLYQDTVHDITLILQEWEFYESYAKVGSVIIFDDVVMKGPAKQGMTVFKHFTERVDDWGWKHCAIGHEQLWGEKLPDGVKQTTPVLDNREWVDPPPSQVAAQPQGRGRFMCLSCGHFFEAERPRTVGKDQCPLCGDTFFCDNILPDVPPDLPEELKAWQSNMLRTLGIEGGESK